MTKIVLEKHGKWYHSSTSESWLLESKRDKRPKLKCCWKWNTAHTPIIHWYWNENHQAAPQSEHIRWLRISDSTAGKKHKSEINKKSLSFNLLFKDLGQGFWINDYVRNCRRKKSVTFLQGIVLNKSTIFNINSFQFWQSLLMWYENLEIGTLELRWIYFLREWTKKILQRK